MRQGERTYEMRQKKSSDETK